MKIGIVVHGPNIIDSGYALKIINTLKDFGEVHCILGGTMGRTAVIDASLEDLIDISAKRLPSESVKLFLKENVDVIVLLNYGKSDVTGHTFGFKVFKNSFFNNLIKGGSSDSNKLDINKGHTKTDFNKKFVDFIQIERPGESDGNIIHWTGKNKNLVFKLANLLNLNILNPEKIVKKYFVDDLKSFNGINADRNNNDNNTFNSNHNMNNDKKTATKKNNEKIRNIHGVSPNENIFVNGIVIGKSNSKNLSLVSKNGKIVDIIGGDLKHHGIEKLGYIDIDKAIIKTGLLRRSNPKPRIISNINNSYNFDNDSFGIVNDDDSDDASSIEASDDASSIEASDDASSIEASDDASIEASIIDVSNDSGGIDEINIANRGKTNYLNVAFIDHAAEDIYNLRSIDLAVTIGDDTTLIASDILYRFNIPVIGITDGDLDKVVKKGYITDGSIIIEVKSGFDDIVGKSIFKDLFNSKYYLKIPVDLDNVDFSKNNNEYIKSKMFEDFKKKLFKIVNNITTEYLIKY